MASFGQYSCCPVEPYHPRPSATRAMAAVDRQALAIAEDWAI